MKQTILIAAAVVAMASCTKKIEPNFENFSGDKLISFSLPVVAPSTKAEGDPIDGTGGIINGTTFDKKIKFVVSAISHNGAFTTWTDHTESSPYYINGATVTFDNTKGGWHAETKYYWPKGDVKLSFQAYAPAAASTGNTLGTATITSTGVNISGYTLNTTPGSQDDLLFSSRVVNKTTEDVQAAVTEGENFTTYYGVQLPFHHALSQLAISAKIHSSLKPNESATELTSGDYVKIKSIIVKNVVKKGTFAQGLAASAGATDDTNPIDNGTGNRWTASTDNEDIVNYTNLVEGGEEGISLDFAEKSDGFKPVLLIPQTFSATENKESMIEITYDYKVNGAGQGTNITKHVQFSTLPLSEKVEGNTVYFSNCEMGKKYTLNIIFNLDELYFAPTITDWTDPSNTVHEIHI